MIFQKYSYEIILTQIVQILVLKSFLQEAWGFGKYIHDAASGGLHVVMANLCQSETITGCSDQRLF